MRPLVLLIVSLWSLGVAQDTIKPLFETRSIADYDRWLWQHREEYPGFRRVRAQASEELTLSGWVHAVVTWFSDSGTTDKRYVFPDSLSFSKMAAVQMDLITVAEDSGRLAVRRWFGPNAGTTTYDRFGRKLFNSALEVTPNLGFWWTDISDHESTQITNDSGRVVCVLPEVTGRIISSGDTLFVAPTRAGVVVFGGLALGILWRDGVQRDWPCAVTISSDGRKVAIAAWDSIIVHDLVTRRTAAKAVQSATGTRRGLDGIAWSGDGSRIAMYRRDIEVPDSATLWEVNRDGRLASPARRLAATYSEHLFWLGDTVVLVSSPYYPDMRGRPQDMPLSRGPCKATAVAPSGKTMEWIVPGLFGQLGVWHQQGRILAYIDTELSYYAVFQMPVH